MWVLILVFVLNGEIHNREYKFREGIACFDSRVAHLESGQANGYIFLVADCLPVSKVWGLQ